MSTYPEHDKMEAAQPAARVIGEFLEWMTGPRGLEIVRYQRGNRVTVPVDIETLLYQYFEIDRDKIEAEKQQILDDIRAADESKPCPQCRMKGGHKMDCSETR